MIGLTARSGALDRSSPRPPRSCCVAELLEQPARNTRVKTAVFIGLREYYCTTAIARQLTFSSPSGVGVPATGKLCTHSLCSFPADGGGETGMADILAGAPAALQVITEETGAPSTRSWNFELEPHTTSTAFGGAAHAVGRSAASIAPKYPTAGVKVEVTGSWPTSTRIRPFDAVPPAAPPTVGVPGAPGVARTIPPV